MVFSAFRIARSNSLVIYSDYCCVRDVYLSACTSLRQHESLEDETSARTLGVLDIDGWKHQLDVNNNTHIPVRGAAWRSARLPFPPHAW